MKEGLPSSFFYGLLSILLAYLSRSALPIAWLDTLRWWWIPPDSPSPSFLLFVPTDVPPLVQKSTRLRESPHFSGRICGRATASSLGSPVDSACITYCQTAYESPSSQTLRTVEPPFISPHLFSVSSFAQIEPTLGSSLCSSRSKGGARVLFTCLLITHRTDTETYRLLTDTSGGRFWTELCAWSRPSEPVLLVTTQFFILLVAPLLYPFNY